MTPRVESPEDARQSRQRGWGKRCGSALLAVLCRRVLDARHSNAPFAGAASRMKCVRYVCVAGIAPTDRVRHGPSIVRPLGVKTASGVDCLHEQPRAAIAIEFASPARRQVRLPQGRGVHVFPSLCRVRVEGEGEDLARSVRLRRGHRAGGVTPVQRVLRPRSQNQKPMPPASWRRSRRWCHSG
jgi:hypothetical protein